MEAKWVMATTRLTHFPDLLAFLGENHVSHRLDGANQLIELPVGAPPLSGVLYIRWEKKLPFVQLIYPFVGDVPADRVREVETAICRANTMSALPGLGYEYEKRFIYMRLCVPVFDEGVLASSFQRQLLGVVQNAKDFVGAFRDIIAGQPGAEIMALAVNHKNLADAAAAAAPAAAETPKA
jgi:hypothetical protein